MKYQDLSLYPEDFEYYYVVCVHTPVGKRYAYNHRTLVQDINFAKIYNTLTSAQRCIRLSNYENAEILKFKRENMEGPE